MLPLLALCTLATGSGAPSAMTDSPSHTVWMGPACSTGRPEQSLAAGGTSSRTTGRSSTSCGRPRPSRPAGAAASLAGTTSPALSRRHQCRASSPTPPRRHWSRTRHPTPPPTPPARLRWRPRQSRPAGAATSLAGRRRSLQLLPLSLRRPLRAACGAAHVFSGGHSHRGLLARLHRSLAARRSLQLLPLSLRRPLRAAGQAAHVGRHVGRRCSRCRQQYWCCSHCRC